MHKLLKNTEMYVFSWKGCERTLPIRTLFVYATDTSITILGFLLDFVGSSGYLISAHREFNIRLMWIYTEVCNFV